MKIAILGNGGFGTAMALVARAGGHTASIWGHDAAYTEELARTRSNTRYLPEVPIPEDILISPDPALALDGVDVVLMAVPTQHVRAVMSRLEAAIPAGVPVVSLPRGSSRTPPGVPARSCTRSWATTTRSWC
jgi:glycerol-3-phosphate dehydrogenase (NAD(P)+)